MTLPNDYGKLKSQRCSLKNWYILIPNFCLYILLLMKRRKKVTKINRALKDIEKLIKSTHSPQVLGDIGLFGGFYIPNLSRYKEPVLVFSTDGVGQKTVIANLTNKFGTIGQDLVNHCANDILVCGAKPVVFLDYFACDNFQSRIFKEIIKGIISACKKIQVSRVSLIGGETAVMPKAYKKNQFDLVGFMMGIAERSQIIDGSKIKPGDKILGLASSGLHTNGYTVVLKTLFKRSQKSSLKRYFKELGCSLASELLKIHRCYVNQILNIVDDFSGISGMAHITGGGIAGNLIRILPTNCQVRIRLSCWEIPSIFKLISEKGKISQKEMFKTFNMGIGLILVVPADKERFFTKELTLAGEKVWTIGEIRQGKRKVVIR